MNKNEMTITAAMITPEFIQEQAADWATEATAAAAAADAYLFDIQARKATLQAQADDLQKQMDAAKRTREKIASQIVDLSSRGELDAAAELDAKLEALDKDISTLGRKLKIVAAEEPKGDPSLYRAADEAREATRVERNSYLERIAYLDHIVNAEITRLEKMQKELQYARNRDPGYNAARKFEAVDRHYKEIDRIAREHREKMAAERKQEQEAARGQHYTFDFTTERERTETRATERKQEEAKGQHHTIVPELEEDRGSHFIMA